MGTHQTHPVNIEQICSFWARRYGDYFGYVEQSWIKWLGLVLCGGGSPSSCSSSRAMIGRNWGARVKEEVGNDAGDTCKLLEPSPAHCGAGLTVLGHSLVISTLLLIAPCRGRGWRGRESEREKNRAAYWDNNVVYTGDSCKPSATALKPRGATHKLSAAACLNGEWAYPPAQA